MVRQGNWRVGDAERDAAVAQLREHYAVGRLTMEEFQARLDAAYAAVTARDLARVTADLPAVRLPPSPGARSPAMAGPGQYRRSPARRRRRRVMLILAALVSAGALMLAGLAVLIGLLLHGDLLLLALAILFLPVALMSALTATLITIGRRAWRDAAWVEAVPAAVGAPWLSRVTWLPRAVLVVMACWRLGRWPRYSRWAGRADRAGRAYARYRYARGGPWRQAAAGDLSGTTR